MTLENENEWGLVENLFVGSFFAMSRKFHELAIEKGFWVDGEDRNDGEMIALFHEELSEVLNAIKHDNPPDKHVPAFTSVEIEFADLLIRIMDTCFARKWHLANAIIAKHKFNKSRPYKHGKKF